MTARHALIPGTFDPPTLGHLDLVRRAASLFERVTLGVADHPGKQGLFAVEERLDLLRRCVEELSGVEVARIEGLLVDGARSLDCDVVVRGVRNGTDLDYEVPMIHTNRSLAPELETVLLSPSPGVAHISSTLVRQIARMGGDVGGMVPPPVAAALRDRLGG